MQKELGEDRRRAEAEERRTQQRQAESDAEKRRRFESRWVQYGLTIAKPWKAPAGYALLVKPEILTTLSEIEPNEDENLVRELVKAAIERAVEPWRVSEEKAQAQRHAVDSALSLMPVQMQWDETWKARAEHAIREAVNNAPDGTAAAAATLAVQPLIAEFQHQRKVDEAVRWVITPGTADEDEEARDTVRQALSALPVNTIDRRFKLAKESALTPIRERIAIRIQQQREAQKRQEAKRRLVDVGMREVSAYSNKMVQKFQYDDGETAFSIELRTRNEVQKILCEELDGSESEREIRDRVRAVMEDLENCR
jgi:hypothetical protein